MNRGTSEHFFHYQMSLTPFSFSPPIWSIGDSLRKCFLGVLSSRSRFFLPSRIIERRAEETTYNRGQATRRSIISLISCNIPWLTSWFSFDLSADWTIFSGEAQRMKKTDPYEHVTTMRILAHASRCSSVSSHHFLFIVLRMTLFRSVCLCLVSLSIDAVLH